MKSEFGINLRKAREKKGLTQQNLADIASVSRSAVTQWEAGTTFPSTANLMLLSRMLDVDFTFDGTNQIALIDDVRKEGFFADDWAFLPLLDTSIALIANREKGKIAADMVIDKKSVSNSILRPYPLRHTQGAYAFQMATTKLEPRFFLGELTYANSRIMPSMYDYTVAHVADGTGADLAFVGRLMSFEEGSGLELARHKPDHVISIRSDQIVRLDRIYTWAELIRPEIDAPDSGPNAKGK